MPGAWPPFRIPHERGFTLIEALVVLAVVGMIATLAYPAVERARTALALRQARGQVLAAISAARAQALRYGATATLAVAQGGTAMITDDSHTFRLGDDTLIRATARPAAIRFHADGSQSGGEISLATPDGTTIVRIPANIGTTTILGGRHAP